MDVIPNASLALDDIVVNLVCPIEHLHHSYIVYDSLV